MVWDEDGPIPTLKMSKTLRNIVTMLAGLAETRWLAGDLQPSRSDRIGQMQDTHAHVASACVGRSLFTGDPVPL